MSLFSWLAGLGRSPPRDWVDIASPQFKTNPYSFYARLRAEAPVYRLKLATREMVWLVTRYDDVAMVLKDERFVKDTTNAWTPQRMARQHWFRRVLATPMFRSLTRNMLDLDPPHHTRLRALVNKAFTPRLIERMRDRVQALTDELLDQVQGQGGMDLIRDYALPLPATIIAEMLGVPAEDRHKFHRWSRAMMMAGSSTWGLVNALPNAWMFMRYIRQIIKERRSNPQDDLTTSLIRAEEAGDTLSEDELVAMISLLLIAGHETSVNMIGNGTLALLEHPDQMARLRDDPTLIKTAVEELLRYASPVESATARYAREDVTIGGVNIRRGDMVGAVIASANRDERQFPNPDTLDITREPNRHLAFGLGNHFCLGAVLARLEGQIAINTLLARVPDLRLAVSPSTLRWRAGLLLRGLESLRVTFGTTGRPAARGWRGLTTQSTTC